MTDKILDIKDLYVSYHTDEGYVYAVNGLDLKIERGETLGLVGETGAGKTTSALSIMRLLPDRIGKIDKGSIVLDGFDIVSATPAQMRSMRGNTVSMIFQDPMTSLNPILIVGDQIAEVIELHGKKLSKQDIQKKVDEMLELVGIPAARKNEYPHQFSGGMKQRVVIAIALACRPQLILADEPTTALDVTIQAQVLKMMAELKEKLNTAMLLITHDLGVVAESCDSVAIMYAGEVIEYGTVEDIFESTFHHPYTEGLFGSIPSLDEDTSRLKPIAGLMPDPSNLPTGCKFHPRCPHCMDVCKNVVPDTVTHGKHIVKCHLFGGRVNEQGK